MVFSSIGAPCDTACAGSVEGTDDAALSVGGDTYAVPGGAPRAVWRKNASQD